MRITLEIPCKHGQYKVHTVYDPLEPPSLRDICRDGKTLDIHPDVYELFAMSDVRSEGGAGALKPRDLFKKYE